MSYARQMIDAYPASMNVEANALAIAIDALNDAAQAATACADACLSEEQIDPLRKCIRADLDAADISETTVRVISRHTEYDAHITQLQLEACMQALTSCGNECQRHASAHEHCRICAEACQRALEACQQLMSAMKQPQQGTPAPVGGDGR